MSTVHQPVMLKEVLEFLAPRENQNFVDGTVGGGGHASAILELTKPNGKLLGLDWDKEAITRASEKLNVHGDRAILVNSNYTQIKKVVEEKKFENIAGILLDLGLSSDQLQESGRGFTFQKNEPLDMRYSQENELTAKEILNTWNRSNLIKIFREYGEERQSARIAEAIIDYRKEQPFETTLQLVELIQRTKSPDFKKRINPATQVFQALRIAVNDELNNVQSVLQDCFNLLKQGGRLGIITFHSLEDRIVKNYFRDESKDCHCPPEIPICICGHKAQVKLITRKAIKPSEKEVEENFRARSAKLRVIEKV
jgi:16S rRNA (cytosine1402-N4)-methyltransferase